MDATPPLPKSTSPPAEYRFHFFLSYTTRETETREISRISDELVQVLTSHDVRVHKWSPLFYDRLFLREGHYEESKLRQALQSGIRSSAFTVSFVSPGYLESPWCALEWLETEAVHRLRHKPAPDFSILPIQWKPTDDTGTPAPGQASLVEAVSEARREGRLLDISHRPSGGRWCIERCVDAILTYLREWYPEDDWEERAARIRADVRERMSAANAPAEPSIETTDGAIPSVVVLDESGERLLLTVHVEPAPQVMIADMRVQLWSQWVMPGDVGHFGVGSNSRTASCSVRRIEEDATLVVAVSLYIADLPAPYPALDRAFLAYEFAGAADHREVHTVSVAGRGHVTVVRRFRLLRA